MPVSKICIRIGLILAVLALLIFVIMQVIRIIAQPRLFHPSRDDSAHQAMLKNASMEYIVIPTDQGELSGFLFRQNDGPAPLLLYYGGNSDNAASVLRRLTSTRRGTFQGWNVAMIDYPGYGLSEGTPGDAAFRRMALAAYDTFAAREDVTQIVVMGYSIGTGPASYAASQRPVDGLILMAPYAEGADLFNTVLDVFYGPLKLLISYPMPSIRFARDVAVRPLIFATEQDELVPYASSQRLESAYPNGCDFVTVPGIGHGGFWDSGMVLNGIADYLNRAARAE